MFTISGFSNKTAEQDYKALCFYNKQQFSAHYLSMLQRTVQGNGLAHSTTFANINYSLIPNSSFCFLRFIVDKVLKLWLLISICFLKCHYLKLDFGRIKKFKDFLDTS